VSVPLYQAKAEFFRTLGHPVRIQVPELPHDGPMPVRDVPAAIEAEPAGKSPQLAVLRRFGIVGATRKGSTDVHEPAGGDVAELMKTALRILTVIPAGPGELPAELRQDGAVAR
jgi:ArsR family transcriptional regulator